MDMKIRPATPLPWASDSRDIPNPNWYFLSLYAGERLVARVDLTNGPSGDDGQVNAAYIVAACNAFPQLVETLRAYSAAARGGDWAEAIAGGESLLRKLGEGK